MINDDINYVEVYDYYDEGGHKLEKVSAIECCNIRTDNSITWMFTKRDGYLERGCIEDIFNTFNNDGLMVTNLLYSSAELRDAAFDRLWRQLNEADEFCNPNSGITTKRKTNIQ